VDNFIGNTEAKVDAKGRVCIPANFRKVLQTEENKTIILRKDIYKDCLVLYPMSAWKEELSKIRARLDEYDEEQNAFYELFNANTEQLEMDSIGRILIPKLYLQVAGIKSEVRFIGLDRTIRLWGRDKYEDFVKENEKVYKINARKFLSKSAQQ
jgi:MraZ protein